MERNRRQQGLRTLPREPTMFCSLLQVPDQRGNSARNLKQLRAQAGPVIKTQNFNAAQWNTGLSEESLKNQRTQTPSAETQGAAQGEMGDLVSSNHGRYFMVLIKVT